MFAQAKTTFYALLAIGTLCLAGNLTAIQAESRTATASSVRFDTKSFPKDRCFWMACASNSQIFAATTKW